MGSDNRTDLSPAQPSVGHVSDSNIFRNIGRLSRKKIKSFVPRVKMSDLIESSDSGNEKSPLVNDFECTSPAHELKNWRKLINIILPVSVEAARNELFSQSKFMDDFNKMKKHYDLESTEWQRLDDGKMQRIIKYKMPLATNLGFGPKYSAVTQVQTESSCCIANRLYAVDVVNTNENIPYGDVFEVVIHHCIISTIDDHSMYTVFGQVRYKKSVWGVVKSRIDKSCVAGMDEFFNDLQAAVQKELCTPPSKGKRSSRKKILRNEPTTTSFTQSNSHQSVQCDPQMEEDSKEVGGSVERSILLWLILGILVAVVAMSAIVIVKIWALERGLSIEAMPDYESLRTEDRSNEQWMHLLRNQQNIHNNEVDNWLNVIQQAIALIQNTEHTLVRLLEHIQLQEILDANSKDKSHKNLQLFHERDAESP